MRATPIPPSVGGRPLPIEPGKLAKGDLLQALQADCRAASLCARRQLALLLQRLGTQAELGVVLQLHEQRVGHVSRPAFGSPAERLDEALSSARWRMAQNRSGLRAVLRVGCSR
ncbi:MAG: hypothetical protein ACLR7Z_18960 [Bilophila wadsworthia]